MSEKNIAAQFEEGLTSRLLTDVRNESLPWVEHSAFKGVFLKHIIKADDTNGTLSCHFVRISPNCCIDHHVHNGKLEVHEVVEGSGTCLIKDKTVEYSPGSIALIPADTDHKVIAGEDGMFILAKFAPALL